jgi:hypothetical protein
MNTTEALVDQTNPTAATPNLNSKVEENRDLKTRHKAQATKKKKEKKKRLVVDPEFLIREDMQMDITIEGENAITQYAYRLKERN